MAVTTECIVVGPWSVNCYLVHDRRVGVIIDPGDDAPTIEGHIRRLGFEPVAIVNTHGHFDHVAGVAALQKRFGIPFFLHAGDKRLVTHANLYRSLAGDSTLIETPVPDRFLEPGERMDVGGWPIEVLHTPGHTMGSVCLRAGDRLFSGDTLFSDGVGRTDLPGGNATQLAHSLAGLASLPPTLELLPGHGCASRLGDALSRSQRTTGDG